MTTFRKTGEKGRYDAREKAGTNTFISVAINKDKFMEVLAR
ncbi:hypothetical protein Rctr197k_131 [Virus Rctr197k]|nr:hypothetical protein Rctr197k_131 [Virus Rctr197k]